MSARAGRPKASSNWEYNNIVGAFYQGVDGRNHWCTPYRRGVWHWRVVADHQHRTLLGSWEPGLEPDVEHNHIPIFYEPETGRLHSERWLRFSKDWFVSSEGWVQESWPVAATRWCPDLGAAARASHQRAPDRAVSRGHAPPGPDRPHPPLQGRAGELERPGAEKYRPCCRWWWRWRGSPPPLVGIEHLGQFPLLTPPSLQPMQTVHRLARNLQPKRSKLSLGVVRGNVFNQKEKTGVAAVTLNNQRVVGCSPTRPTTKCNWSYENSIYHPPCHPCCRGYSATVYRLGRVGEGCLR